MWSDVRKFISAVTSRIVRMAKRWSAPGAGPKVVKILVHIIIVLAVLALPLLLPPSCGPAVHSEAVLTAGISN